MIRTIAIDVRCPTCGAPPGESCRHSANGYTRFRRPHPDRRQAAHQATAAADPTRCDRCGRPWNAHAIRHRAQA